MTDCKSLHHAKKSAKQVGEKRLRLEITGIKELVEKNIVKEVKWQTSYTQLADCLTQRAASSAKSLQVLQEGKISLDNRIASLNQDDLLNNQLFECLKQ